jgi:hypothetical protein
MRRATMAASHLASFYRPKKGEYRRRTPVPVVKPVKGKLGLLPLLRMKCDLLGLHLFN